MDRVDGPMERDPPGEDGQPGRPWAYGIGLVLLGVLVASGANALRMMWGHVALGAALYLTGLAVAGYGVHLLAWFRPSRRPLWQRILATAALTVPAFVVGGILLGVVFLIAYARYGG